MILLLFTDGKNSILHKTFNVYGLMKRYTRSHSKKERNQGFPDFFFEIPEADENP
jgi:hypothetical protein